MQAYSWKLNLFVLWIGAFFISMSFSISIPFLPIFLQDQLGIHDHLELWSGAVFSVSFLASAFVSPFWGSLADKYGRKPMLIRAATCLTIIYSLYYFVQNPYQLVALRILEGLLAGYIPAAVALVATNTPEKKVGYALGIMSTAMATGSIIGPLIGGFVSHLIGNREAFLFSSCMSLMALITAWIWVKEGEINKSSARTNVLGDLKLVFSNRSLLFIIITTFVVHTSVMIIEPLLTIYVIQLGASSGNASLSSGIIFSAVGLATLIAAPRWGKFGGTYGYDKILFIGLVGGGLGNLLQIAFHDLIGFGSLRFIYGLFFAAVFPAISSLIVQFTDTSFRGRAFGLNQSAMQMGTMVGPMLGGLLASVVPIPYVFLINSLLILAIAVVVKVLKVGQGVRANNEIVKTETTL
ncbi:MFS transporter [Paenibacillus agricola]|uniref:Multidrug efflux MFS transporter n=1 Tax=Paenibacillus agricola TaxID=2716264 RepID=A0ABX0JE22_9BACL|nr:MFS transporter [Paenibacillus agricola]NHN34775.1 multidrug efflux MFS transporter [Paenibacillus agricola]